MNENVQKVYETLKNNLSSVIVGKERVCELAVISLLCGGHMLLDDVPGTGKTVFAKTFAASLSLDFKRKDNTSRINTRSIGSGGVALTS